MPMRHSSPKLGACYLCLTVVYLAPGARTQDIGCPDYPVSMRIDEAQVLEWDRQYGARTKQHGSRLGVSLLPPANNVIDARIFKKMSEDGVPPTPLTSDAEFAG